MMKTGNNIGTSNMQEARLLPSAKGAIPSSDDNEQPSKPPTPQEDEIKLLKQQRVHLINMLHTIRTTLQRNTELVSDSCGGAPEEADEGEDYDIHYLTQRDSQGYTDASSRLTYRGEEKALDLLRCFDRDHDDMLDLPDFISYLTCFDRIKDFGYLLEHPEAWLAYMEDLYETDRVYRLTTRGFLMYREATEDRYPISADLARMKGMDPITRTAKECQQAKVAFDRLDVEAQGASMERLLQRNKDSTPKPIGRIPSNQLQLLLGDCNDECLSVHVGQEFLLYHQDHMKVLHSLKAKFARKEFTRKPPVVAGLQDRDEIEYVYKEGFLPWFMSDRPRQDGNRFLERQFIWIKNKLKRIARDGVRVAGFLWRYIMFGIKRGLLHPQVFLPRKAELGRYEIGFKLRKGDSNSIGGGLSITAKWQQLDNDRNVRKRMKMPAACGLAFSLDLLINPEASLGAINAAIGSLKRMVTEHLEADIINLPKFLNWQVFQTQNDMDNLVKVIRIAIYLKNETNVENVLRSLQLGITLRDLITDFSFEFRSNLDLHYMANDEELILDEGFACQADLKCNISRGLMASLLEEIAYGMDHIHGEWERMSQYQAGAAHEAKQRTIKSHPQLSHRFLQETFKFHYTRRSPCDGEDEKPAITSATDAKRGEGGRKSSNSNTGAAASISRKSIPPSSLAPSSPSLADREQEEARQLFDFPLYRLLSPLFHRLAHALTASKTLTLDFHFKGLKEALFDNALIRHFFSRLSTYLPASGSSSGGSKEGGNSTGGSNNGWVTCKDLEQAGGMVQVLHRVRTFVYNEVKKVERDIETHAQAEVDRRHRLEAEEERKLMKALEEGGEEHRERILRQTMRDRDKVAMMKRLQGMGIGCKVGGEGRGLVEDEEKSRWGRVRKARSEHVRSQRAMLTLYRALAGAVVGPHSMHVTSGRYRFYVQCEGVQCFDTVLPKMQQPEGVNGMPF